MEESDLSEAEKRYLRDLESLPSSIKSRVMGWTLELVPSIGLFCYGLAAESQRFVVLGFLSLLYFSVWRIYGQFRGFRLIQSVYMKRLTAGEPGDD